MIRKYFFSTCAAALSCIFFMQPSLASETNMPAAKWAVGQINAKSEGGMRYCSMKNSFRNGNALVFARNEKGSNSIAIDFKKPTLEVSRQYSVAINAGAASRHVTAIAATTQIMVMQVGADNGFNEALRGSKVISFNTSSGEFTFNLDDTAAALKAFDDCANSISPGSVLPEKSAATSDSNSITPASEKKIVERKHTASKHTPKTVSKAPPREDSAGLAMQQGLNEENARLKAENRRLELAAQAEREENQRLLQKARQDATQQKPAPVKVAAAEKPLPAEPELIPDGKNDNAVAAEQQKPVAVHADEKISTPEPGETAKVEQVEAIEQPAPVKISEKKQAVAIEPRDALKDLLDSSHVADGKIEVKDKDAAGVRSYRWVSDNIYGAAHELPWTRGKNFSEMADGYIKQEASRCKGDFARTIGGIKQAGNLEVLEAEMACLDGKNDAAAAVLFLAGQGNFRVITQEGTTAQMSEALLKRDSIVSTVFGNKL